MIVAAVLVFFTAAGAVEGGFPEMSRTIMQDDPETWNLGPYTRTGGPPNVSIMASRGDEAAAAQMQEIRTRYGLPPKSPRLHDVAPRALGAQLDCVGGRDRVKDPELIRLVDSVAVNLCGEDDDLGEDGWRSTRAPGWHKDGWHFRHFLDARGNLAVRFANTENIVAPVSAGSSATMNFCGFHQRNRNA